MCPYMNIKGFAIFPFIWTMHYESVIVSVYVPKTVRCKGKASLL